MNILSIEAEDINLDLFLSGIEIFNGLDKKEKQILINNFELIQLTSQEILIRQGDEPDYLYIIYSGRLIVYKYIDEGQENILATLGQGELIGEMALISHHPRSASIKADRQSFLLRILNSKIDELMKEDHAFLLQLTQILLTRMYNLIHTHKRIEPSKKIIKTIAVIGAGDHCITDIFIKEFLSSIAKFNTVFELKYDALSLFEKIHQLIKLEVNYDFVIFNCNSEISEWSMFAIENADCVLLIGDAGASPACNALESYLFNNKNLSKALAKYLVLIHPSATILPKNTTSWLSNREFSSIHHVCFDNAVTLSRLVRTISNKSVSLILSGGGANGYAHIGVIRALSEAGIEIDAIGGVSIGAMIAALYAMGLDDVAITHRLKNSIKKFYKIRFSSIQLPLCSLISPRSFEKIYNELLDDIMIENLWVNYFCLACNLETAQEVIFERGLLKKAVIASSSIPGLTSPAFINHHLYIDGGASNTMPGDIMKDKYPGFTIAVNVSRTRNIIIDPTLDKFPSTKEIILNRLNPFSKNYKIPYISEILNRSIVINNKRKLAETKEIVDYVIEPDLSAINPFDHKKMNQIIEIGYKQAKRDIEKFQTTMSLT